MKLKLTKTQKRAILTGMRALLVRPGGWTKGTFSAGRVGRKGEIYRSYCLAGAANDAALNIGISADRYSVDVVEALSIEALAAAKLAAMGARYDREQGPATFEFNDRSKTRKSDVLALVDEKLAELA